jgi:hypothetical protein
MTQKEIIAYERSAQSLETRLIEKKKRMKIKITSYVTGETKISFLEDCLKYGICEAELLRRIIRMYYRVISKYPELKGKDFKEIEEFILNKK